MHRKSLLIGFLALACVTLPAPANGNGQVRAEKAGNLAKPKVEATTGARAPRYERINRADPFLNPLLKSKKTDVDGEVPKGDAPPGIAGMNGNDVELLGVSLSPEAKTAAFRGTDKRVYFLQEGDRVFDGYLKAINNDSVLLIRETKLRSGKVLAQEITKRLRTR